MSLIRVGSDSIISSQNLSESKDGTLFGEFHGRRFSDISKSKEEDNTGCCFITVITIMAFIAIWIVCGGGIGGASSLLIL